LRQHFDDGDLFAEFSGQELSDLATHRTRADDGHSLGAGSQFGMAEQVNGLPESRRGVQKIAENDQHAAARGTGEQLVEARAQIGPAFRLGAAEGFKESAITGKRRLIQSHLRDRLFEISRRNRLIYFKPTLQTLNLTIASVPVLLFLFGYSYAKRFTAFSHFWLGGALMAAPQFYSGDMGSLDEFTLNVSLFDLLDSFRNVLRKLPGDDDHPLARRPRVATRYRSQERRPRSEVVRKAHG